MSGLLVGCAMPPAVLIASQAVDGVSYFATGKSSTDHILSAALDEDCALHRVISGIAVCQAEIAEGDAEARPKPKPENGPENGPVQTASLAGTPTVSGDAPEMDAPPLTSPPLTSVTGPQAAATGPKMRPRMQQVAGMGLGADTFFAPHPGGAEPPARGEGARSESETPLPDAAAPDATATASADEIQSAAIESVPVRQAASVTPPAAATHAPEVVSEAVRDAMPQDDGPRFFIVLGSFSSRSNAERAALGVDTGAGVAPATVLGRTYYRVVGGPFDRTALSAARKWYTRSGFAGAWPVPACTGGSANGCITLD